ncbi:ybaK/ebsC protein [Aminomonas paucivorans DSM 12260]|uniref:Cys-tRNA(Pro)/Cys-tRNA(Cys) deacylase n=1 Tax=Aminomonas paucivorans DSM 12260 TaxID=584708 RepID=E3CYK4_9BACT|nr:Cys-tRNA(Pro) deacylase [Aminomonas paucivorans]EFQ22735.1 ybaK/ebsC protein [Aminomonas paucivorans DSM 12260]
MKKTNAARLLEGLKIPHTLQEYPVDESDLSAEHVAREVGLPLNQVFKTLVARGDRTGVIVAVLPGGGELDPKALASVSGNKKVDLVPLKEVQPLTGYLRGGCSPLGMKKKYPVFLDESARAFPFISVSAGLRGIQVYLAPEDLRRACEGTWAPLARRAGD